MDQRTESQREVRYAWSIYGGAALFLMGGGMAVLGLLTGMLFMALLGFAMLIFGMLAGGYSLLSGLSATRPEASTPIQVETDALVAAKYAYNDRQDLISDTERMEFEEVRFYVRLGLSGNRGQIEFECAREVWDQCPEGMRGNAHVKGRWLGAFEPTGPGEKGVSARSILGAESPF